VDSLIRTYGLEGFAKTYTSYSAQYKMDVLNYMNETGMSSVDAAAIFNISSSRLLVSDMLNQALTHLQPGDEVILHSDQGWHYQMKQ
jgi:peptidyl-tRNA hydrolase